MQRARENATLSGVDNVRWIVEDARKYVAREVRRGSKYDGIILHAVPDHAVDSFTLMAIQYPGLEITHMLLLFARFDIFQRGAFGHHRNVLLSLGSPATCTLASLDFLTGHRKVTLIQFYHPFQCIPCIPVAHRPAEFVYHRPYRFVTLQS